MTFTFGKWVCPLCGSDDVEVKTWVVANTGELVDFIDREEEPGYCRNCDEEIDGLKWAEPPESEN